MTWTVPGYTAERMLGFGTTGEVWAGRDLRIGDRVALKRLRAGCLPVDRDRIRGEVARLAAFEHPHVLRLRGVRGVEDGLVLVLDLAEGGSFAGVLAGRGPVGPPEVGALCGPIARALVAAHTAGLVHGDVSPGNLLLDALGRPLLADLGTRRLAGETDPVARGTTGYADPAVPAGAVPTAASDVYGLAAVAVHLLTGRPPDRRRPAAVGATGLLGDLSACLDPDPERRPAATALEAVFEVAAAGVPAVCVPWAGDRATEDRAAGERGPDNHAAGDRATDGRATDGRAADGRVADGRGADTGAGDGRAAGDRAAVAAGMSCARPSAPGLADTRGLPRPAPRGGHWLLRAAKLPHWWCRRPAGGGGSWYRSGRDLRRWPRSVPLWPRCRPFRWRKGGPGPVSRWAPAVPAPLGAVVVLVVGLVLLWPGRPPTGTAARSGARVTAGVTAGAEAGPWGDRVRALDRARSVVFARGAAAGLRDVYAAGSSAAVADAAAVAALTTVGAVAPGVRHEVLGLRILSATPSRARLELTDRMPGYRVLDRRGRVLRAVPPRAARTFRLDLVASPAGWRIAALGAVAPGPVSAPSPSGEPRPRPGGGT